jgi:hypothetical protein
MPRTVTKKTAAEYAAAVGPHLEHEWYRCDKPQERLLGKGCRTCDVEAYIAIADFIASGDLDAYEKALTPHLAKTAPKPKRKKK